MSYEQMKFDINNTQRWISFCSDPSLPLSSFNINLQLGGDNAASYSLSSSYTTINIVSSVSNIAPTFTLSVANVQKTYVNIQMTTNAPGFFFYHIQLSPLTTPYPI